MFFLLCCCDLIHVVLSAVTLLRPCLFFRYQPYFTVYQPYSTIRAVLQTEHFLVLLHIKRFPLWGFNCEADLGNVFHSVSGISLAVPFFNKSWPTKQDMVIFGVILSVDWQRTPFTLPCCPVENHWQHASMAWMVAVAHGSALHKYPHPSQKTATLTIEIRKHSFL